MGQSAHQRRRRRSPRGRFNRQGVEALYLSLDEVTALREDQQTSPFLPPCTMCSYSVALSDLVDLRQLHHVAQGSPWDELWHDWREDWRHLKFERHIEPPTWVLADMVLAHGYTGILFPSQAHERGINVAVYSDRLKYGCANWRQVLHESRLFELRCPSGANYWPRVAAIRAAMAISKLLRRSVIVNSFLPSELGAAARRGRSVTVRHCRQSSPYRTRGLMN